MNGGEYDLGETLLSGVENGHRYKVVQNPDLGHFCGYVQTNFSRPWTYDDIRGKMGHLISVHGGLTYGVDSRGYIGFDCAHAGDVCILGGETATDREISTRKEWTPEDVEDECVSLARQIDALETFAETFDERGWGDDE